MTDYVSKFFGDLIKFRSFGCNFFAPAMPWIELIAFTLSVIFIVLIVYCLSRSKQLMYQADEIWDTFLAGEKLLKRRTIRGWKNILKKMKSRDSAEWRAAIFEADRILGHTLRLAGYQGTSVHERLNAASIDAISNLEELKRAHTVRERLAKDSGVVLTREEALEIVRIYREGFRGLELID